ncbi:MAG: hypothetical protein JST79_13630 [Acidobacteria bacterium]|jgi:hypothetical protein|nr:hypothetical protein [Acidobacteriota bacterium]
MPKKATAADAQIVLQLYDLRREAEMRKARHWWLVNFWPQNADDFIKVANSLGTQENAWFRQVSGYWDMAASLVLHGAVHADLFLEGGISGEMFFLFAKIQPFLKEIREKMQSPRLFLNVEKVVLGSKAAKERFQLISKRVESRRKAIAEAK